VNFFPIGAISVIILRELVIIFMYSLATAILKQQLIVSVIEAGRRRRTLLSVDAAIIACLANLLPEDVADIIGCLCARQKRDGPARKVSIEKIKIDMAALDPSECTSPRAGRRR